MSAAHLYRAERARFAEIAAVQRDAIVRTYPALVAAGQIEAGAAQQTYAAWEAIWRWCAGVEIDFDFTYEEMAHAAGVALQRGEAACLAQPDNPRRRERRDQVAGLHILLCEHRDWIADINVRLRADAERRLAERKAA